MPTEAGRRWSEGGWKRSKRIGIDWYELKRVGNEDERAYIFVLEQIDAISSTMLCSEVHGETAVSRLLDIQNTYNVHQVPWSSLPFSRQPLHYSQRLVRSFRWSFLSLDSRRRKRYDICSLGRSAPSLFPLFPSIHALATHRHRHRLSVAVWLTRIVTYYRGSRHGGTSCCDNPFDSLSTK